MPSTEQNTDAHSTSSRLSQAKTEVGEYDYPTDDEQGAVEGNTTSSTTGSTVGGEGQRADRPRYRPMSAYTSTHSDASALSGGSNSSTHGQTDRNDSGRPSNIPSKAWRLLGMDSSNDGSAATSAAGPSTALAANVPDKARELLGLNSNGSRP